MFEELDRLLGFDFSTLEDSSETHITKDEETGVILKVWIVGKIKFRGSDIDYSGFAITAKEDYDLATELVGENIAVMRAQIGIIEQVLESFTFNKNEMKLLVDTETLLKQELVSYIDLKEQFYTRVRNRRENPDYYRVKQVYIDDDGVPHSD